MLNLYILNYWRIRFFPVGLSSVSEVEPPNDSGEEPEDQTELSSEAPATALDEVEVVRQGRKWTKPFRWLRERRRRIRWKVLIARLLTWGLVAIAVFALLLYTGIRIFVKADDIRSFAKAQVEEQTGGKLEIGGAEFMVLTGVQLSNVQFYPPASGDTRGFAHGGEINPIPLANFEALDVRYSVAKFFAGRIHIKALQLIGPEFHLKQVDGVWNFDSILAYRAVHFPPEPETPEDKAAEATKKSTGTTSVP